MKYTDIMTTGGGLVKTSKAANEVLLRNKEEEINSTYFSDIHKCSVGIMK